MVPLLRRILFSDFWLFDWIFPLSPLLLVRRVRCLSRSLDSGIVPVFDVHRKQSGEGAIASFLENSEYVLNRRLVVASVRPIGSRRPRRAERQQHRVWHGIEAPLRYDVLDQMLPSLSNFLPLLSLANISCCSQSPPRNRSFGDVSWTIVGKYPGGPLHRSKLQNTLNVLHDRNPPAKPQAAHLAVIYSGR